MSISRFFFLTKEDMISVSKQVEKEIPIKFVKIGSFVSNNIVEYNAIEDIPNLGIHSTGDHVSDAYMVMEKSSEVFVREVKQANETMRYVVDQGLNKGTILRK